MLPPNSLPFNVCSRCIVRVSCVFARARLRAIAYAYGRTYYYRVCVCVLLQVCQRKRRKTNWTGWQQNMYGVRCWRRRCKVIIDEEKKWQNEAEWKENNGEKKMKVKLKWLRMFENLIISSLTNFLSPSLLLLLLLFPLHILFSVPLFHLFSFAVLLSDDDFFLNKYILRNRRTVGQAWNDQPQSASDVHTKPIFMCVRNWAHDVVRVCCRIRYLNRCDSMFRRHVHCTLFAQFNTIAAATVAFGSRRHRCCRCCSWNSIEMGKNMKNGNTITYEMIWIAEDSKRKKSRTLVQRSSIVYTAHRSLLTVHRSQCTHNRRMT